MKERFNLEREEHRDKLDKSEKDPEMELCERSISDREEEHRGGCSIEPEMLEEERESEVNSSMEKRWVETEEKSVESEREVRSKEVTLELELLQKTPVK